MGFPVVRLTICVLSLTIWTDCQSTNWEPFSCRRPTSNCGDAGVCMVDGRCRCRTDNNSSTPVWQGFDCALETSKIVTGVCAIDCQNGAICWQSAAPGTSPSHHCYCSERYTGSMCEKPRVSVEVCNDTHIGIYVNPYNAHLFTGRVSIVDPDCNHGRVDKQPDDSYMIVASLHDDSDPCHKRLNVDCGLQYVYTVNVKYELGITVPSDEILALFCQHDSNGKMHGGIYLEDPSTGTASTLTTVSDKETPVTLSFLNRSGVTQGDVLSGPVNDGQELFARISLDSSASYTALVVVSCTAFGNVDFAGDNVVFLDQRCLVLDALPVVNGSVGTVPDSNNVLLVPFLAAKLSEGNDMLISCNVTLCSTPDSERCKQVNCSEGGDSRGTPTSCGSDSLAVSGHLILIPPPDSIDSTSTSVSSALASASTSTTSAAVSVYESTQQSTTEGKAGLTPDSPVILEAGIIVGIVVGAAVILLVCFAAIIFCVCKRRKSKLNQDNVVKPGKTESDDGYVYLDVNTMDVTGIENAGMHEVSENGIETVNPPGYATVFWGEGGMDSVLYHKPAAGRLPDRNYVNIPEDHMYESKVPNSDGVTQQSNYEKLSRL